jgi:hypothetical protein
VTGALALCLYKVCHSFKRHPSKPPSITAGAEPERVIGDHEEIISLDCFNITLQNPQLIT